MHIGNVYPSVPLAYAPDMKETYEIVREILDLISYRLHDWKVVADFKIIGILCGLQGGNTKYPCFICEWDSRDRGHHYIRKDWPQRIQRIGQKNIMRPSLVSIDNIILPPLHIKLGLMAQFVKALNPQDETFQMLRTLFPNLTVGKVEKGNNLCDKTL